MCSSWKTWNKRHGRKEKRIRKERKRSWEEKNREKEKRWLEMPWRSTSPPGWRFYIPLNSYAPTSVWSIFSLTTPVWNQCFDPPLSPLRPSDDFWVSLPLFILKAQVLHSFSLHSYETVCPEATLCPFLFPPTIFSLFNLRTWDFQLPKTFRDKMKLLLCPRGLEMIYQIGTTPSLNVPPKHLAIKKKKKN